MISNNLQSLPAILLTLCVISTIIPATSGNPVGPPGSPDPDSNSDLSRSSSWTPSVCPHLCRCRLAYSLELQAELRTVDCQGLRLTHLPRVTDIPPETQVLLFARNRLRRVPANRLFLPELLHLDLSQNLVRGFGCSNPFEGAFNLKILDLSRNQLAYFRGNVFQGLFALEELRLDNNRLSVISDDAFRGLQKLEVLRMAGNRLTFVQKSWFAGLGGSLYELKLARNRLSLIQSDSFLPLQSLLGLDLSDNRIFKISSQAFNGLRKLEYLRLDKNRLLDVPSASFSHLSGSLKSLSLNNNPIYRISTDDFSRLPELRDLSMTKMHRLHLVDSRAFNHLPQLLILELHDNAHLTYLDPVSFLDTPRLTHLLLHNNNLSTLSQSVVYNLPSLEEISFYGNPLACDCNAHWLKNVISADKIHSGISAVTESTASSDHYRFKEAERIVCASPSVHMYKVLSAMDASEIEEFCHPQILDITEGDSPREIDAKFGDDVVVDCKAVGVPSPLISWRLPSGSLLNAELSDTRISLLNGGSTLKIKNVRTQDTGGYTCIAENAHGEVTKNIDLAVSDFDVHLNIHRVTPSGVTLTWDGNDRNRGVFEILYRMDQPGAVSEYAGTVTPIMSSYTVSKLQPNTPYEVCIALDDNSQVMVHISCTKFRTKGLAYLVSGIERTSNIAVGTAMGIIACMLIVICLALVGLKRNLRRTPLPLPNSPSAMENALLVPSSPPGLCLGAKVPAKNNIYEGFAGGSPSTEKLLLPPTPCTAVSNCDSLHFPFPPAAV